MSAFHKKLKEFQYEQARRVAIFGTHSNSDDLLISHLIQFNPKLNFVILNFADSNAHLSFLCKRLGISLSKHANIHLIDGADFLGEWTIGEYPITAEPPFTVYSDANQMSIESSDSDTDSGKIEAIVQKLRAVKNSIGENQQTRLVIVGLEVLFYAFKNQAEVKGILYFLSQIFKLNFAQTITSINWKAMPEAQKAVLYNFLESASELQLELRDLETGFSKDLSGNILFSRFDGQAGEHLVKSLRFKVKRDAVDFYDQLKIN